MLKGSLIVALGLMSAQAAGFARQAALGFLLGTGPEADALSAAMAPIELWWSVLALTVIFGFVPMLSDSARLGGYSFRSVLKPTMQLAVGSSALFYVFADPIVSLIAPGLTAETAELGARLLRVMALSPAAIGISFAYSALLFSRRRFALASLHHAVVNVGTIAGALLLHAQMGVFGFVWGYVAGAWIQLALAHLHARQAIPDAFRADASARKLDLWTLITRPGPILSQALAMELNTAVSRAYASTFGLGMTAAFEYAFKLFRVPMALLVIPLSHSLLPEMSGSNETPAQRRDAVRAMTRAAVLTVAASAGVMAVMILLRDPAVTLLFQRGAFGRDSTEAVSTVLLSYMPVILGRGVADLLSRTLFGMGIYRAPVGAAFAALAVNAAFCTLLPSDDPRLIGVGAVVGFAVSAAWIIRRVRRIGLDDDA